jgi:DivIVA domain-containing protein
MADTPTDGSEAPRKRLTPVDVQQHVFRRAMLRGYNEQDVDDFLDVVTEELGVLLEEQQRLRDELATGGSGTMAGTAGMATAPLPGVADVSEATRMAEDILQRARDEAAEILRRARTEAAAASGGGRAGLQPFIAQERAFLQDMSRLIQGHAETIKQMATSRREQPVPAQPAAALNDEVTQVPSVDEAAAQSGSVSELFYGED